MPRLPKTVFVHWEETSREEDPYLVADEDIDGHIGECGVYTLNETLEARVVTETKVKGKKNWVRNR